MAVRAGDECLVGPGAWWCRLRAGDGCVLVVDVGADGCVTFHPITLPQAALWPVYSDYGGKLASIMLNHPVQTHPSKSSLRLTLQTHPSDQSIRSTLQTHPSDSPFRPNLQTHPSDNPSDPFFRPILQNLLVGSSIRPALQTLQIDLFDPPFRPTLQTHSSDSLFRPRPAPQRKLPCRKSIMMLHS